MAKVRMLKTFKGYGEDTLQDFGDTENARLVSLGYASNDLDGPAGSQTAAVSSSRSLTPGDSGLVMMCDSASAVVLTIPVESFVDWPVAAPIAIYQAGAGASSFAAGAGVTLRGTPPTPAQYATHAIMRVGVNEWAYL